MTKFRVYFESMLVTAKNEEAVLEKVEERLSDGEIPEVDYIEEE